MKRAGAGLVLLATGLLLAAQPAAATTATPSPSPATSPNPSPSPLPSPSARPSPTPDPNKALFDQLATRLRGDLTTALGDQQRLSAALDQGRVREQKLSDQVDAEANKVSDLEDQVAQLDDQVSMTQEEVDRERAQVAGLARSLYRRPSNWLVLLAGAKDVHQALLQAADTIIAGRRAHALQLRLESDLAKLEAARAQRQQDLEQEMALKASLEADLNRLDDQLNVQDDIANQLLDLTDQMQTAMPDLRSQSPADATKLIQLLEAQQRALAAAAAQNAWSLAAVGSGRYESRGLLPTGQPVANLKLEAT